MLNIHISDAPRTDDSEQKLERETKLFQLKFISESGLEVNKVVTFGSMKVAAKGARKTLSGQR